MGLFSLLLGNTSQKKQTCVSFQKPHIKQSGYRTMKQGTATRPRWCKGRYDNVI